MGQRGHASEPCHAVSLSCPVYSMFVFRGGWHFTSWPAWKPAESIGGPGHGGHAESIGGPRHGGHAESIGGPGHGGHAESIGGPGHGGHAESIGGPGHGGHAPMQRA